MGVLQELSKIILTCEIHFSLKSFICPESEQINYSFIYKKDTKSFVMQDIKTATNDIQLFLNKTMK